MGMNGKGVHRLLRWMIASCLAFLGVVACVQRTSVVPSLPVIPSLPPSLVFTVSPFPPLATATPSPVPTVTLAATLRGSTPASAPTEAGPGTEAELSSPTATPFPTRTATHTFTSTFEATAQVLTGTPVPPTSTPTPTSLAPVAPTTWEQEITLNTYAWQQALVPSNPDDPFYPYPRLDFGQVGGPTPRTYRAVFIQNRYVQLVVVPELGGRILRWTDRITGRLLTYANPVIKPTRWGYRGWWFATGGIEWAFPTEEHGLNEYRPWQYERLRDGVRVWDTDDRTGLTVEVTIRLDAEHSYVTINPRITNPTATPQPYQFWANAMLTLSGRNTPSPALIFILPDNAVTVHSTGDNSLPGPGGVMNWPVHNGRDFSSYSEWRRYLGVFADPALLGFVGAYDLESDQGFVRVFPHTLARGVKIFCLGDLDPALWTDDHSRYFEIWGGLTPTFWAYWTLEPGATVSWTERWYPVSGMGGYNWANEEAAVRLTPLGATAELAVMTTRLLDAVVVLRRGGVEVQRWSARIGPGQPFRAVGEPSAAVGEWGLQVWADGSVLAQFGR